MRISERVFVFAGVTMLCVCCPEKFLTTGNGDNKHEEVMNGNSESTEIVGRVGGNRLDGGNYLEKYNDLSDFYANIHSTQDVALCITASLYADKNDVIE